MFTVWCLLKKKKHFKNMLQSNEQHENIKNNHYIIRHAK